MHIFRYSPRPGTAAAKSNNNVDRKMIKKRSEILHKVGIELARRFREQFIGETAEILIENDVDDICGRSERFFMVHCEKEAGTLKKNDLVEVKLIENRKDGMIGTTSTI
jgi:threonylcarbamoyladenosine tRNA methylthiotransferase MtaB